MIRRRCKEGTCTNGRRCLEHLRFDVMWRGRRYRMPINEYAIPRMEPGKQRPIESMEEARDWERRFIGEIKAGRDPRRPPGRSVNVATELSDVSAFLDAYFERCAKPAGLVRASVTCFVRSAQSSRDEDIRSFTSCGRCERSANFW